MSNHDGDNLLFMADERPEWVSSYRQLFKNNGFGTAFVFWYSNPELHINPPDKSDFINELEQLMLKHHITVLEAHSQFKEQS